jgi:sugar phosphate isomerase/epimerase
MKFSMGAWSFTFGPYADAPKLLPEVCARLKSAGYDGIELSGYPPHVALKSYKARESRGEIRRLLADQGLGVSGYSADLTPVNPLIPSNRQRYLDRFERLLELCMDVGSPSIRIDTGAAPGSLSDEEYQAAFHQLADVWRGCAVLAEQAQVRIVWEFEPGFIFNKPSEVVALHQMIGHPWFQVLFDTSHAYLCSVRGARQQGAREVLSGGITSLLGMLRGRVGGVHVVDTDGTLYEDETSTHLPLHRGVIGWPTVIPQMLEICQTEWWCVDLAFCAGAWDAVESSLRDLQQLVIAAQAAPPV